MALGMSAASANAALDTELTARPWVKLHIGDPGAAGTANAAGNTTRKQATWSAASGGSTSNSGAVPWTDVSTTEDYTHFTTWSAASAGTFGISGLIVANPVITDDDFTLPIAALVAFLAIAS